MISFLLWTSFGSISTSVCNYKCKSKILWSSMQYSLRYWLLLWGAICKLTGTVSRSGDILPETVISTPVFIPAIPMIFLARKEKERLLRNRYFPDTVYLTPYSVVRSRDPGAEDLANLLCPSNQAIGFAANFGLISLDLSRGFCHVVNMMGLFI